MMNQSSDHSVQYYCEENTLNQKELFKEALHRAQNGKVLYILQEELTELPQLSQDLTSVNRHYMKMISFLYAKTLSVLIESVSTLTEWQNVPSTIIIDKLNEYCPEEMMQNACGVMGLLIDTARRCSNIVNHPCKLLVSVDKDKVGANYCTLLRDLYPTL